MSTRTSERESHPRPVLPSLAYAAAALASAALLALGTRAFLVTGYFEDDAFISLRYARRLAEGAGLTWNDGEAVEGYSNLLWVLAEAGAIAAGADPVVAMRALGLLGTGLGLLGLGLWLRPRRTGLVLPGAFAMLAFSSTQLHLVATASGFETPFVIGLLGLALLALLPAVERDDPRLGPFLLAGAPLGLLALNRPDGALFTAAAALGLLLVTTGWRQRALRALGVVSFPTACVLGQLAFRLWTYGDWIPNTARVKLPGSGLPRIQEGLAYVLEGLHYQRGLWLPALLALGCLFLPRWPRSPRLRGPAVLLLVMAGAWTAYVIQAGGVWPEGRRFLVPTITLATWLAGLGLRWAVGTLRDRGIDRIWIGLLALLLGLSVAWLRAEQWRDPQINRALHSQFHWREKGMLLAELWGTAFAGRGTPTIAVDTAGAIPYYTGWPAIDMLGLCDRWIATHPPPVSAWTLSGHTHGDGPYVIDRAPDLVIFGVHWGTWGGVFTGGRQMHEDPRFYQQYRYLEMERIQPRSPRIRIWLRLDSPVLGVIREPDRVEIPAWFVANQTSGRHRIDDALRLPLAQGELATATGILVPAGRWLPSARFDPRQAGVPVGWEARDTSSGAPIPWDEHGALLLEEPSSLDLSLRVDGVGELALLEALILARVPDPSEDGAR